jgi:hypothetical protein
VFETRANVMKALHGHVLGKAVYMGLFRARSRRALRRSSSRDPGVATAWSCPGSSCRSSHRLSSSARPCCFCRRADDREAGAPLLAERPGLEHCVLFFSIRAPRRLPLRASQHLTPPPPGTGGVHLACWGWLIALPLTINEDPETALRTPVTTLLALLTKSIAFRCWRSRERLRSCSAGWPTRATPLRVILLPLRLQQSGQSARPARVSVPDRADAAPHQRQRWTWSAAYLLLMALTGVCAWSARASLGGDCQPGAGNCCESRPTPGRAARPVTWKRRLRWVMLAGVPSSLMLSVTTFISTDIASVPLLW